MLPPVPVDQLRDRDQVYTACRQGWQQLFQHVQGFGMGMADADGVALSFRNRYQLLELLRNFVVLRCVIQKHVPLQVWTTVGLGHLLCDGIAGGSAVEEVQTLAHLQRLHEPSHRLGLLGQQAAHVVAYTHHLRQGRQVVMYGPYDLLSGHAPGQRAWPQRLSTDGLHGQVQQDLPIPLMCQRSQMEGIRGIGKK